MNWRDFLMNWGNFNTNLRENDYNWRNFVFSENQSPKLAQLFDELARLYLQLAQDSPQLAQQYIYIHIITQLVHNLSIAQSKVHLHYFSTLIFLLCNLFHFFSVLYIGKNYIYLRENAHSMHYLWYDVAVNT